MRVHTVGKITHMAFCVLFYSFTMFMDQGSLFVIFVDLMYSDLCIRAYVF